MTNAKRLWCGVLVGAVVLAAGLLPASGQDAVTSTTDALTDFAFFAVKPEGDEKDYKLVPVGETKLDGAELKAVIKSLPDGLFGIQLSKRDYDQDAEVAQCQNACNANNECQQFEYIRPTSDRPVGLCRLKRSLVSVAQGTMSPVADETPKAEPATHTATTPAAADPSPASAEEGVPPPPRITKPLVIAFPLPPRPQPTQEAAAPAPVVEAPPVEAVIDEPKTIVPPAAPPAELLPVEAVNTVVAEAPPPIESPAPAPPPPPVVHSPTADLPNAEPIPAEPKERQSRGMPIWLAIGSVAFMFAGAGIYRRSYQKRQLTRMTTRLVSDGIDGREVSVENTEKPDLSLRFIVRNSAAVTAPDTRILAIADGAFAS